MKNARISAIDIVKGIGIVLVIIGHALPANSTIRYLIYTFHMPLFFILAGMVMKTPERNRSLREDFLEERKLFSAYCFYSIVYVLFDIIVRKKDFDGLFWDIYQTASFFGISVLWFLPTMALAKILVKWICRISNKRLYWLIAGIVLLAASSALSAHIIVGWLDADEYRLFYYPLVALLRTATTVLYILIGYMMRGKVCEYICKASIKITIGAMVFATLLLRVLFRRAGYIDIRVMWLGNQPIAFICAILGFVVVFGAGILIDKISGIRRFFCYLGINSLFIMATHGYLNINFIAEWGMRKLNLWDRQYTVLLQIITMIITECILCKLCAPYVERVILLSHDNKKRK